MTTGMIIFLVMMAAILIFRVPIGLGMLSMGVVYLKMKGKNIDIVAHSVINLYWTNYILIAVPLFIFTANVMNAGKITEKIFNFADGLVGRFRGGLAHVNVLASLIFAGMSGSATADASGLGLMEITEMRKHGYEDGFSCAITAASATIGPIFPPSISMLVYSSLTGASVGALFMGGMVPGVLMALFLSLYIALVARRKNLPYGAVYTFRLFMAYTIGAVPALLTPVILLGCIYSGVVTPTEAGALAGGYALLVSYFVYRALSWATLKQVLFDTVTGVGSVAITIGCASVIQYISGFEKMPAAMGGFITQIADNKWLFLFIANLLFLFLGTLFESNTITLIFIPMLMPLLKTYDIDLVHFGVVFTVNMMIGMLTPPYGQLLFVTSAVSGVNMVKIIREVLPMILVMIALLLIMTYFPPLVTFLPGLLG